MIYTKPAEPLDPVLTNETIGLASNATFFGTLAISILILFYVLYFLYLFVWALDKYNIVPIISTIGKRPFTMITFGKANADDMTIFTWVKIITIYTIVVMMMYYNAIANLFYKILNFWG